MPLSIAYVNSKIQNLNHSDIYLPDSDNKTYDRCYLNRSVHCVWRSTMSVTWGGVELMGFWRRWIQQHWLACHHTNYGKSAWKTQAYQYNHHHSVYSSRSLCLKLYWFNNDSRFIHYFQLWLGFPIQGSQTILLSRYCLDYLSQPQVW